MCLGTVEVIINRNSCEVQILTEINKEKQIFNEENAVTLPLHKNMIGNCGMLVENLAKSGYLTLSPYVSI